MEFFNQRNHHVPVVLIIPPQPKPQMKLHHTKHFIVGLAGMMSVVLSLTTVIAVHVAPAAVWQGAAGLALFPNLPASPLAATPIPWSDQQGIDCIDPWHFRGGDAICVRATGVHDFICAALPWAQLAQRFEQSENNAVPGPHDIPFQHALPHPWYVSVLLAQWLVEQGNQIPAGLDGYNWGNSSGIPGFDEVPGTGVPGSPNYFAFAHNPLQGIEIHTIFTKMHFYTSVWQAYPYGPIAQARALGRSPWDAAHYDPGPYPGYSLVARIEQYHLEQYDRPYAIC
jgi:hypothetical protein